MRQRKQSGSQELFCFAAPARQVRSWAKIRRTSEHKKAAQRMLNMTHVRQIRNYIDASPSNVIPTAVTIALRRGSYSIVNSKEVSERIHCGTLEITHSDAGGDEASKPGTIIDGQHRLFALESYQEEDIPVLVVVLLGVEALELALHFVVINNTAKKVPTDLVKAILSELSDDEQQEFEKRVRRVGLTLGKAFNALAILDSADYSPFYQRLDWDSNRSGIKRIKPSAIESALRLVMAELETPDPPETDDAIQILAAMWQGIRDSWQEDIPWDSEKSKLLDKAGLVAATEFVVQRLNLQAEEKLDLNDDTQICRATREIFNDIPSRFWLLPWTAKSLDTSAGRKIIQDAMATLRRNKRKEDPFKGVDLVAPEDYIEEVSEEG
jgi:DGQHR domain-containing protein